jgi:hypothetical protein
VRAAAVSALALAMERELQAVQPHRSPEASLRAVGAGYLRFARAEQGLFHTAFAMPGPAKTEARPDQAGDSGLNPFQLLGEALDRLVEAGIMPAERRPGAEYLAWSAVHGLALLMVDGPLRDVTQDALEDLGRRMLEMVVKGL